jgi:hypothetical protein
MEGKIEQVDVSPVLVACAPSPSTSHVAEHHQWAKHWGMMGSNLGRSVEHMLEDAAADNEEIAKMRAVNVYLVTTSKGRAILKHRHIMLCPNNPFRIAALLIARKHMRMHKLSRKLTCPLPVDKIKRLVGRKAEDAAYLDPDNSAIMYEAQERFVNNHTGGVPYGAPVAVRLW